MKRLIKAALMTLALLMAGCSVTIGFIDCPYCGNTGTVMTTATCPSCGGAGGWYNPSAYFDAYGGWQGMWMVCAACGGAGTATLQTACPHCHGLSAK